MSIGNLLLASALLAAGHATSGPVQRQITASYGKIDRAVDAKSLTGLLAFLTPKYTYTSPTGRTFGLAVERKDMAAAFATHRTVSSLSAIQAIQVHASGATADLQVTYTFTGTVAKTGKPYTYIVTEQQEDDWIRTPSGWRIRHTQIWAEQRRFNGVAVPG